MLYSEILYPPKLYSFSPNPMLLIFPRIMQISNQFPRIRNADPIHIVHSTIKCWILSQHP